MWFDIFGASGWLSFFGVNHYVEILQNTVFFYAVLASCLTFALNWTSDLKRFFFYSELAWLALFCALLINAAYSNTTQLHAHAFFVLVFTACEAVTLACVLLVLFETRRKKF